MTSEDRVSSNVKRATVALRELKVALRELKGATTDEQRLAAAKALESAACQLRRALKTGGN